MVNPEEYINVKDALRRIGGSMDLYKRLLNQFIGGDHIEPLEEALKSGDTEKASHLVHTLKGVCANLSLVKLAGVAVDLEHNIKDGEDYTDNFEELKAAYEITSQQIALIQ